MNTLFSQSTAAPGVTVITSTHRVDFMERILNNYLGQDYPNKELIVILNNNNLVLADWKSSVKMHSDIRVFQLDEDISLGECYNFAVCKANYGLIAKFDDDDCYTAQYLSDATRTHIVSKAEVVGKLCRFVYFSALSTLALCCSDLEYQYTPLVVGASMLINKDVFHRVKFPNLTYGEDTEFQKACLESGYKIYSGSRFEYATIRHAAQNFHTYQLDDRTYLNSGCQIITKTTDFLSLIKRESCHQTKTGR